MSRAKASSEKNRKDALAEALQGLGEHELLQSVLVPLFKALGYDTVDAHHGPDELGRDMICWRTDELGDPEVSVAQVKLYKPTRRVSDKKAFAHSVTQLSQAAETPVPHVSGQAYLPRNVYFITPFVINTRTLSSRFDGYAALRVRGVKIIDGARMAALLLTHLPSVVSSLCGDDFELHQAIESQLNNDALLNALNAPNKRPIESFYTDIDFSVGKASARRFLLGHFAPEDQTVFLTRQEWDRFKELSSLAHTVFGTWLTTGAHEQVERQYRLDCARFTKLKKKHAALRKKLEPMERRLVAVRKGLFADMRRVPYLSEDANRARADTLKIMDRLEKAIAVPKKGADELARSAEDSKAFAGRVITLERELGLEEGAIVDRLKENAQLVNKALPLAAAAAEIPGRGGSPAYTVKINARRLARSFKRHRSWILTRLRAFNRKQPTVTTLRAFLLRSNCLLEAARQLLQSAVVARALCSGRAKREATDTGLARLHISVNDIGATGANILILGEAGAGKTTSLQMYAKKQLATRTDLCLFAPLARVAHRQTSRARRRQVSPADRLVQCLASYLMSINCPICERELVENLNSRKVILLLDGIDEAVSKAPWILHALAAIPERFPKAQVITSSRTSGEYVNSMPFIAVTLLPFTDEQRGSFISKWFKSTASRQRIRSITAHLRQNRELAEIVRNPLLTTVMCTLVEHGVPLPENEVRLYEERLNLLLGQYDVYKEAVRIRSRFHDLKLVAQKIAFRLHAQGRRDASREDLYRAVEHLQGPRSDGARFRIAVDELIHPCNIIVPMTEDGKFGFGHLRYQEHLAALEIHSNRDLDVASLAGPPWWQGVFLLLGKMLPDIEWLINELAVANKLSGCRQTVELILNGRPLAERRALSRLVHMHMRVDQEYFVLSEDATEEQRTLATLEESWETAFRDGHDDDGLKDGILDSPWHDQPGDD